MFNIEISFDELNRLEEALVQLKDQMEAQLAESMQEAETYVHEQMAVEPEPMSFPPSEVHWDSPKQRVAYHATDGFGGGDPYRRAGRLDAALQNTAPVIQPGLAHGSVVAIEDFVKYVIGNANTQSNIHKGRFETINQIGTRVREGVVEIFQKGVNRVVSQFKI